MCFEDSIIALQPRLKRFAFSLVKDSDLADDLVQDTLYRALKFRNKWDVTTNLKAWLFTILKNSFINDYRRIKKSCIDNYEDLFILNTIAEGGISNPESSYCEKELLQKIEQLKDSYKTPFKMLIEGYKYEEISEKLQINLGTVKSRIFLARKKLMSNLVDNQNNKPIITTMNDIAKQNVKQKIEVAMHTEVLTNVAAATVLGIKAEYISLIKNPKTWDKCPSSAWETVLAWVNSGQSLTEYAKKHGRIVEAKPVPVIKESVIVPKPEKIVPEVVKSEPKPMIKIKSGVLEKRKEEIAVKERRASRGEMVDMLIEEKESLRAKIEAIDILLKHYIS